MGLQVQRKNYLRNVEAIDISVNLKDKLRGQSLTSDWFKIKDGVP
jgi:hypothetical protein